MDRITRRSFLGITALALSQGKLFAAATANNIDLGFQTYPIREMLGKDIPGTFKMMADMGYKLAEMCYPKTYEKIGYAPFVPLKASEIKKIINDAGLSCPSCHFGFADMSDDEARLDEAIAFSKELGLKHMILSTFWLPKAATLNDYLSAADKLNKASEKIKSAGLQAGFHNHSFEFVTLDGELIYDALMKRFDPNLVKMQFQTEVINLGFKASDYFKKYPGRFFSAHLSDWTKDKEAVPIGQGIIDWNEFFVTAKAGGVETYFVEMAFDTYKPSAAYIANRS